MGTHAHMHNHAHCHTLVMTACTSPTRSTARSGCTHGQRTGGGAQPPPMGLRQPRPGPPVPDCQWSGGCFGVHAASRSIKQPTSPPWAAAEVHTQCATSGAHVERALYARTCCRDKQGQPLHRPRGPTITPVSCATFGHPIPIVPSAGSSRYSSMQWHVFCDDFKRSAYS